MSQTPEYSSAATPAEPVLIGWREWLVLPELGIPALKAKIDTGARTSALHAFELETFYHNGAKQVRFALHPLRRRTEQVIRCSAAVIDERTVTDSGGHRERRYVIATRARLGGLEWPLELTLTDRETMLFRMLLGRTALAQRFTIDPAGSYLCGRDLRKAYRGQNSKGRQNIK